MDCVFCKIANKQIPSDIVFENENIIAFKDLHAAAPVHVLIVPKYHIDSVSDINEDNIVYVNEIFLKIPEIVNSLNIKENGYRIIINTGDDSGQTIKHLHVHIIGGIKLNEKLI